MKRVAMMLVGSVVLVALTGAASATIMQIQIGGLDLVYDGVKIVDAGGASPDPLTNATFLLDGVNKGAVTTGVTMDLMIPGVSGIPAAGGQVSSDPGGTLSLTLGSGGDYLTLTLGSAVVSYIPLPGTVQFVFVGSAATIDGQQLPFGLSLGDPVSVSVSSQITQPVTQSGGIVTGFETAGTGEIQGVPEPGTIALLALGALAALRRRRA
ncbi:MAG: PEP-CTERM sorting domain-containing protein [Phycisphaerae bacterium]